MVGKTKEKALKILKDLGLTVTVETKESEKADGIVLAQSKAEGTAATAVVVDPDAPAANNEVKE